MSKDNINPDHYKKECSLECIEAMELAFGCDAVFNFCLCNAWKYIWRWKNKNGIEDLKKADWYVLRALSYTHGDSLEAEANASTIIRFEGYIFKEIQKWEKEHEEPTV